MNILITSPGNKYIIELLNTNIGSLVMSALKQEEIFEQYIVLPRGAITIGRAENNSIVIEDITVSQNHAQIYTFQNTSHIKDLDSKNGVYVNGKKTHHHIIQTGDSVRLGSYSFIIEGFE